MANFEDLEQNAFLAQPTRTLQVIVGALVMGLLTLIVIAAVIASKAAPKGPARGEGQGGPSLPVITGVAFVMAAVLAPLSVIVPSFVVKSARKRLASQEATGDLDGVLAAYQTKTILAGALLEAAGHMAAIAYMLERRPATLGLALAFVIGVALLFPTPGRVERWVDDQLGLLGQERQFGG